MNRFLILFLANIAFSYSLIAQCVDTPMSDIFTPNGKPVVTWVTCESSLPARQALDAQYSKSYPNAQQIKTYDNCSSTAKFNCHGYAWLRVEGGPDRWIGYYANNRDPDIYMTDYSYVEVTQAIYPGKVFWERPGDHSAVTTDQSGLYISKWRDGPLMKHQWNYSPFGSSNLKYYVKAYTITGPSEICSNSSSTFTVFTPPNATYTWTCSNNLTAGTASGNTNNFTANGNGQGWVAVNVGGKEVFRRNVWVGAPSVNVSFDVVGRVVLPPGTLIQPTDVFIGDTVLFHSNAQPTTASVTWTSTAMQYLQNGSANIYYIFQDGGGLSGYNIKATATNSCGSTSSTLNLYPSPVLIKKLATSYPNPVSDVLNITIDASDSQNQSRQQGSADTKSLQTAITTYDVRLYNRHGRLLRQATTQGGSVQFNVTHLRDGIYYLHIYDGVSDKPEIHQIMVKH